MVFNVQFDFYVCKSELLYFSANMLFSQWFIATLPHGVKCSFQSLFKWLISDYISKNYQALEYFKQENVQIKQFPIEVLSKLNDISDEILLELSQKNSLSKKVYDSYVDFLQRVRPWTMISEDSYLNSFK